MLDGLLVVMNGNCEKDLNGLYTVFIPTLDRERALDYVKGNGDIVSCTRYTIDITKITDDEKLVIFDRMVYFSK